MTKFKNMDRAMALPRIPGREDARQKAWAEYKESLQWFHPLVRVLCCQVVLMSFEIAYLVRT